MACLTAPIGSALIGVIIDKWGRRTALLCSVLPCMVGWFLLYLSCSWTIILAGQILTGVSSGTLGFPAQVYAGECIMVNHVRLRNNFLSWHGIGLSVGMCVVLLMSSFLNCQQISAIATVFSLTLFLLIYAFIPESPSWLYLRSRVGGRRRSWASTSPFCIGGATRSLRPSCRRSKTTGRSDGLR